jgi:hypothetical protein
VLESTHTSNQLSRLRKKRPSGFVWKINDRTRGGIADVFVLGDGGHAWSEWKRCPVGKDPHTCLTALQKKTLSQLYILGQIVYVVGIHPNGEESVYEFGQTEPCRVGRGAFVEEMEWMCFVSSTN